MAKKLIGIAPTAKGRQRRMLQDVVSRTGHDPEDLTVERDERSGITTVTDRNGNKHRYS